MRKGLLFVVCSLLFAVSYSFAQEKKAEQEVDGFSLVQYEDGGSRSWELNGKSAEVQDEKVKVDEVSAVLFGDPSSVKIKAKQGSLDRVEEIVKLDDEVVAKATDGTMITCDGPLEINYSKNRATFLNNVKVKDVQGDILADRIDVYFSRDTRRIKTVVARGNVRIVNGESVTYSEKAIYLVDQGRVVLPKRPRLVIQGITE